MVSRIKSFLLEMSETPLEKEFSFMVNTVKVLQQVLKYTIMDKLLLKQELSRIYDWYDKIWISIQKEKDPNFYELESQRPPVIPKEIYAPTLNEL